MHVSFMRGKIKKKIEKQKTNLNFIIVIGNSP